MNYSRRKNANKTVVKTVTQYKKLKEDWKVSQQKYKAFKKDHDVVLKEFRALRRDEMNKFRKVRRLENHIRSMVILPMFL